MLDGESHNRHQTQVRMRISFEIGLLFNPSPVFFFFFTYSWFKHVEKWDTLLCDVFIAANLQRKRRKNASIKHKKLKIKTLMWHNQWTGAKAT